MEFQKLLKKWDLTSLEITAPFLETESQFRDDKRNAARELYVELITRDSTQHLKTGEGDEAAALRSIDELFGLTRSTLSTAVAITSTLSESPPPC